MKSYNHLYPKTYDLENLYQAFRAAPKGKRNWAIVAAFPLDGEHNLPTLESELRDQIERRRP